jgi:hypothetical protein
MAARLPLRALYAHGTQRGALLRLSGGDFADHYSTGGAHGDQ